jgi:hypothetical protein
MAYIQVTLGSGATPLSASKISCNWVIVQNNTTHAGRCADTPSVSATVGMAISAGGGSITFPFGGPSSYLLLSNIYVYTGTSGDVIDVEYEPK